MGIVGVSCFNTFAYLGLQQTTATNALLINSFIPIIIILLSRIKPGIPISLLKMSGILVSSAGVVLLVTKGSVTNLLALSINQGDLWILLAAFTWAVYSISLRWRPAQLSAKSFLLFTMLIGFIFLGPFYWFNVFNETALVVNSVNLMAILYVAAFASVGAFLLWNQGVKLVGAAIAGQFIHLMPVLGTIMAVIFLGESLFWYHVIGAVAIATGILLSLRQQSVITE
jgi:drug/metabolite transporter (DMT)-like permease